MKRVAILTFINTENYGALLQAYALSYICRNMGCTTHFLREQIAPLRGLRWVKNIVWTWVRSLLGYTKRRAKTKAFARKFLSGGKLYSGNGISTDIIGASIRAYLSAVNKIVYEEA